MMMMTMMMIMRMASKFPRHLEVGGGAQRIVGGVATREDVWSPHYMVLLPHRLEKSTKPIAILIAVVTVMMITMILVLQAHVVQRGALS